jgi:hypothetical protein
MIVRNELRIDLGQLARADAGGYEASRPRAQGFGEYRINQQRHPIELNQPAGVANPG